MPGPLPVGGQYRYLSFKMRINGAYALPADGMIGRWIWQTTNGCTRVSEDIPYEVGEQLYTIDLYDPANGTPVEASPGGCSTKPWKEAGEITRLRFDPNQNWTGNAVPAMTFHQEFDWLRLTKVDRVARGSIYSVQLKLNRARSELKSLTYSYTTNPDNFAQDSIQAEEAVDQAAMDIQAIDAGRKLYLPLTRKDGMTLVQADVTYNWNTSNVPAGTYYICATANDGYSSSTFCSDAPVEVYNP
jgi:hypothetical protein